MLTLLFLNIFDGIFAFSGFRAPHNENYDDILIEERFDLGQSLKSGYDIPSHVCTWESSGKTWYLYSNPLDSIASKKNQDDNKYFKDLKEDIDSLNGIINRCRYNSNKDFFRSLILLKKEILYVHEKQTYKTNPIIKVEEIYSDSILIDRILFRDYSNTIVLKNYELLEFEIDSKKQYEKATKTLNLFYILHPVLIIYESYFK